LQIIMDKLESEGAIKPRVWLTRLEEIANSDAPDRVPALRLLLAYRFGGPPMHLQIEHGLTESAETILRRIAQSDAHRERLEALERRRLRAASITAEVVEETVAAAPDVDDATAPAAVGGSKPSEAAVANGVPIRPTQSTAEHGTISSNPLENCGGLRRAQAP